MMKVFLVIIFILLVISSSAYGQFNSDPEFAQLSPARARNYSLFFTLGSVSAGSIMVAIDPDGATGGLGALTMWMGVIFFPGIGQMYSHDTWGFWRGVLLRLAGTGTMITALVISWDDPDISGGWELFIGGGTIVLGSAIYDICTAQRSAEHYNEKMRQNRISFNPCYFPKYHTPGIMLSIKF